MLSLLQASMLHASPAEPGLRPARPHGKPVATPYKRGEHLKAGRPYKQGAPTADERGAVRGMHRPTRQSRFSWDALTVTSATQCGWYKCYFPSQRENEGWLVGRPRTTQWRPRFRDVAPPTLWFPPYSRAWALAEELRTGFGVDHLLRGPPLLVTLPHEQATR